MGSLNGDLPLRPLTAAELLDTAVDVLRRNARVLLPLAALLALAREALLLPLRIAGNSAPPYYLPYSDELGWYWLQLATGLASEAFVLGLLGICASRAAAGALLGVPTGRLLDLRGSRFGAVLAASTGVALVTGVCALAGLLLWPLAYGLLGLLVPTLVIDRTSFGRAIGRSLRLSTASGMRGVGVRLLGWFAWLVVRLAFGIGALALIGAVFDPGTEWLGVAMATVVWTAVNAVAYAALACLDAVLQLETRMRVEGLDIWLTRRSRAGTSADVALLAVRR